MRTIIRAASARSRRRAFSSLYVGLLLVPLAGFASLSIDMGRVRLARANLQAGADAAARAGASGLPISVAACQDRAAALASANYCLNTPIALNAGTDLVFGNWDAKTRTFTALPDTKVPANNPARAANAVRVTTYRTAARNGPIPLTIASVLNVTSADVATYATAVIRGGPTRFGVVALDFYNGNGNKARIDSYDPAAGPYTPGTARYNASLASNGDIDLGNSDVWGDVRAGMDGGAISQKNNSEIYGWTANLDQPLVYPPAAVPPNAVDLPSGPNIAGGPIGGAPKIYKTKKLSGQLTFDGPVRIYVYGSPGTVDLSGGDVIAANNLPANLEVFVVGSGDVNLSGNSALYAHIYAPESKVVINGTPDYFGWLVGKSVTVKGTSAIHYDESITGTTTTPYRLTLVQ